MYNTANQADPDVPHIGVKDTILLIEIWGRMPNPQITTVKEALFWTYTNLAMCQTGYLNGIDKYGVKHYSTGSRL